LYNSPDVSPGALVQNVWFVWIFSNATRMPVISAPLFLALGVAGAESALAGTLWAALCLLLTSGLSTLYLEYLRRNVRLGDPARLSRGGALRPVRVIAAQYLLSWALLTLLGVPFGLGSLVLVYATLVTLLAILVPEEEISLHAAAVCGAAIALAHAFGPWGLSAALLLPPLWLARTATGRYTPHEIASGALAGTLAGLVVFLLT
jgi:hypothetical protein